MPWPQESLHRHCSPHSLHLRTLSFRSPAAVCLGCSRIRTCSMFLLQELIQCSHMNYQPHTDLSLWGNMNMKKIKTEYKVSLNDPQTPLQAPGGPWRPLQAPGGPWSCSVPCQQGCRWTSVLGGRPHRPRPLTGPGSVQLLLQVWCFHITERQWTNRPWTQQPLNLPNINFKCFLFSVTSQLCSTAAATTSQYSHLIGRLDSWRHVRLSNILQ